MQSLTVHPIVYPDGTRLFQMRQCSAIVEPYGPSLKHKRFRRPCRRKAFYTVNNIDFCELHAGHFCLRQLATIKE